MRTLIIFSLTYILLGCSAAGVVYTADPYKKVNDSYIMMNQGRPIPAERFAKEALVEFTSKNDHFGKGEAHIALGLLYKTSMMKKQSKSISHFKKAIEEFTSANNIANTAKAKFGLANAYAGDNQNDKQCEMYNESLKDYELSIEQNPNTQFKFNPAFSSFGEMVKAFTKEYCKK